MKSLIFALFIFFSATGRAGIEVNNGAGVSEQNLVYAFANLETILSICLQTPACALTDVETDVIKSFMKQVKITQLTFSDSTKLNQTLYRLKNESLLVNASILWKDSAQTMPYSLVDAIDLIFTIFDRGEGNYNQILHDKIENYLRQNVSETHLSLASDTTVRFTNLLNRSKVLIQIEHEASASSTLDITDKLREGNACSGVSEFLPPVLQAKESTSAGFRFRIRFKIRDACKRAWRPFSALIEFDKIKSTIAITNLISLDESTN